MSASVWCNAISSARTNVATAASVMLGSYGMRGRLDVRGILRGAIACRWACAFCARILCTRDGYSRLALVGLGTRCGGIAVSAANYSPNWQPLEWNVLFVLNRGSVLREDRWEVSWHFW